MVVMPKAYEIRSSWERNPVICCLLPFCTIVSWPLVSPGIGIHDFACCKSHRMKQEQSEDEIPSI
jgi:hypothetical protein